MFGIMFGDLGQGAVILVLGILVRRFSRKEWARDFGFVLGACGVVAMLFGAVVYGSFFSREGVLPKVPGVTTTLLQIGGTENTSIIRLFIGTVALGIILMSVGIIINIINNFGRRGFYHGMLDKFGLVGLVFYWGALGILLLRGSSIILAGIFIILPLVLLFVAEPLRHLASRKQETHGEGLGMKFVESGVDTMETVMMYLANTVSFLRLAGFALAHAGLSLAMWMIFAALSDMPVVGWAVVVLGNIVIIGLEGLVAGIQSIRLEYYEFFTKFLRGEGKAFEPFRLAANSEK
jgi:V/A-type H+-transporting ATPase subunit I